MAINEVLEKRWSELEGMDRSGLRVAWTGAFGDATTPRDETLFKNIALAHRYFDMIRSGETYSEIAKAEGASKRRVQQLVELAFLAPDIIRDVWEGGQPAGLTSHWLKSHAFSPMWVAQRDLFRAL